MKTGRAGMEEQAYIGFLRESTIESQEPLNKTNGVDRSADFSI
jgi:hypothetical protein